MKTTELNKVKEVLKRIKNQDAYVVEALAYIDRDLAIRDQARKAMRDMHKYDYPEYPW